MYVIATVFCSNFHFSVSLQVPFFKRVFSIYYLLAKFGFDTAENEPLKVCKKKSQKLEEKLEKT